MARGNWGPRDAEYRTRIGAGLRRYYQSPQGRSCARAAAEKRLASPTLKEKIRASAIRRFQDPDERAKVAARLKLAQAAYWATPVAHDKHSAAMSRYWSSKENRDRQARAVVAYWSIPGSREKASRSHSMERNHNWRGGLSFEEYPQTWTDVLKDSIRARDGNQCRVCGVTPQTGKLHVHHIDYDKKNCVPGNLISLCRPCHTATGGRRWYWEHFFKGEVMCG